MAGSPASVAARSLAIMIFDLGNVGKRYFDEFAIRALYLDAGSGECLGCLHATHDATDTAAINHDNLYIIFAVEWLQSC